MKKLLLAVPKGRILDELNPLLVRMGIIPEKDFFNDASRKIIFATNRDNLAIIKVRSFDVATFVQFGGADLGICGLDVLTEFSSNEIFPILDLGIGKCRLSLAAPNHLPLTTYHKRRSEASSLQSAQLKNQKTGGYLPLNSHLRLATKYPNLTSRHFANLGIQAEIIKLNGAMEIAPKLGLCDYIVDLVGSGQTLKENNLVELEKILDVTSHLIINRTSFKTANQEINELIKLFDASR
ncbi:MAG: ATP phosphoribosyltransferase [Alphaproteobacteria bacterium]|nr:ATP phosphoribosyltransferase [Alphaproteobacteria bacterium]